jgi:hypothetical protein
MSADLDARELLNSGEAFSFFQDDAVIVPRQKHQAREPLGGISITPEAPRLSGRLDNFPSPTEFLTYVDKWEGNVFQTRVWVGSGVLGDHPAINEYMNCLRDPALRKTIGPASPSHVMAGVPEGSLIFTDAWDAMILPGEEMVPPPSGVLTGMSDVIAAIKRYRLSTRSKFASLQGDAGSTRIPLGDPHFFWTGQLEVLTKDSKASRQATHDWR